MAKSSAWDSRLAGGRVARLLLLAVQLQDLQLLVPGRVGHHGLHQEAVELGLGQVIGPLLLHRVLGRQHHEELRQRVGPLADRDLVLGHGLQQGRLDLGRGPVDLVGEQDVVEQRALAELELALARGGRCRCR